MPESKLSWGKPKVEVVLTTDGAVPVAPTWIEMKELVEKSSKLTTTKGTTLKAPIEGGALLASKAQASGYVFELEIYAQKGATKPIDDVDGVIAGNYVVRLTPEDTTVEGWIMENSSVSVEETWDAEIGKKWKYTFEGLKPKTGAILKPYTQA